MPAPGRPAFGVPWLTLFAATAAAFATLFFWVFFRVPVEAQMGVVYKIFYVHVPSAYAMYVGFALCGVGSLVYLIRGNPRADRLAECGAELGLLFALIVLVTGPLWGRKAWGVYWVWDHRLTTTLLAALIFGAYLAMRGDRAGAAERRFSAALALIGLALLPLIHYSVRLWRGQHPTVITSKGGGLSHPDMKAALLLGFVAFTLMVCLLVATRYRLGVFQLRVRELEMDQMERT